MVALIVVFAFAGPTLVRTAHAQGNSGGTLNNSNIFAETTDFDGVSLGDAAEALPGFAARTGLNPWGTVTAPTMALYDYLAGNDSLAERVDPRPVTSRDPVTQRITSRADITDQLTAKLLGFFAFILGLVVSFLGKIILLLVNVLLGFLVYNGFSTAPPVIIGWKMVRDLVNMFFIVVLILSCYATILGWKTNELHVKNILPKLLIAAVLVNFSRTIVAILVDASQIVMLTFVNAFASIGAGNFANALHLPLITDSGQAIATQTAAGLAAAGTATNGTAGATAAASTAVADRGGAGAVILDVILASVFQIVLLVIAVGVLVMMVIFVVARIVGIWMLMVFSPIPFLVNALPSSITKVLGKNITGFWDRLGGLLVGGPMMAFWLWLTFATLSSQTAGESLGIYQNVQAVDPGAVFSTVQDGAGLFLSAVGNARGLGSYVIAVAMMMMGLESAMEAANSVGVAGEWMKAVGKKTQQYAQRAAFMATGIPAGMAVARTVDSRYDLSGRAAAKARNIPFLGQNKWLKEQQFKNRKEWTKDRAELAEFDKEKMWRPGEREDAFRRAQVRGVLLGQRGAEYAQVEHLTKRAFDTKGYEKGYDDLLKKQKDATEERAKVSLGDNKVAEVVANRTAKADATIMAVSDLTRAKELLTGDQKSDEEERKKIDDQLKKIRKSNPHLITNNEAERTKQLANARQNWKDLDPDAKRNFDVIRSAANTGAFREQDGRVVLGDRAAIEATRKRLQGQDKENFNSVVKFVEQSQVRDANGGLIGTGVALDRIRGLSVEMDKNDQRRILEISNDGNGTTNAEFVMSDRDEFVQADVRRRLVGERTRSDAWSLPTSTNYEGRRTVTDPAAQQAVRAGAATIGVGATLRAIASDVPAAEAAPLREAAADFIRQDIVSTARSMNEILNEPRDANGQPVPAGTPGATAALARYNRPGTSAEEKAQIFNSYQRELGKVMPVLESVSKDESLTQEQQIGFLGSMGHGNLGYVLNTPEKMLTPAQARVADDIRTMARENIQTANTWLAEQETANAARMTEFRTVEALPEGPRRETELRRLAAANGGNAYIRQYNQYRDYSGVRALDRQMWKKDKTGTSSTARERHDDPPTPAPAPAPATP